jgi:hypothetical protein
MAISTEDDFSATLLIFMAQIRTGIASALSSSTQKSVAHGTPDAEDFTSLGETKLGGAKLRRAPNTFLYREPSRKDAPTEVVFIVANEGSNNSLNRSGFQRRVINRCSF